MHIGTSGHRAQHADLTVGLGFSPDLGVASHCSPEDAAEGPAQMTQDTGVETGGEEGAQVAHSVQMLGVPARRRVNDPRVRRSQEVVHAAKCHLNHTPTLHTGPDPPELIGGTLLPQLAPQTLHPYRDFLLQDLGPDPGDDFGQGVASGDAGRKAPLWGLGLQESVNRHADFLHDGPRLHRRRRDAEPQRRGRARLDPVLPSRAQERPRRFHGVPPLTLTCAALPGRALP